MFAVHHYQNNNSCVYSTTHVSILNIIYVSFILCHVISVTRDSNERNFAITNYTCILIIYTNNFSSKPLTF